MVFNHHNFFLAISNLGPDEKKNNILYILLLSDLQYI